MKARLGTAVVTALALVAAAFLILATPSDARPRGPATASPPGKLSAG